MDRRGMGLWDKGIVQGMSQGHGARVGLWTTGQGKGHGTMEQWHGTWYGRKASGHRTEARGRGMGQGMGQGHRGMGQEHRTRAWEKDMGQ